MNPAGPNTADMMRFRVGFGWDVHRTEPGEAIIIGGVPIPAPFRLAGHSDADVLLHAITDAVLGAANLGDIGMHFPDTDPKWRNSASDVFLKHAIELAAARGYRIVNVDATVVLERPKLKDYRRPIQENISSVMGLDRGRVSVKFKTAEKTGPVGEGRSVEAQAVVLLVSGGQ